MDQYGQPGHARPPIPPMRVSSLSSSRTMSSVGGRSSEASSMRSGRSGLSLESATRTSQESTKPRLSKDQQEFLERQFAHHPKPNTQTKKGFANDLNVPLEKINNWFQNRRAKCKQDAKKKQNSYSHFGHPLPNGHHLLDQAYIDQAFYHPAHPHPNFSGSWHPPVLTGHSVEPSVSTNNAQFGLELDMQNRFSNPDFSEHMMNTTLLSDDPTARGFEPFFGFSSPGHPIDSQAMDMYQRQFFAEPFPPTMDTIPEYDIPDSAHPSHLSSAVSDHPLSRQNTLGAEELANSITYPPRNGDLPMPPSADFFHPADAQPQAFALPTWGQSAGRPLDVGHGSMQEAPVTHGEAQLPYRPISAAQTHPESSPALYQSPVAGATFSDRTQNKDTNEVNMSESLDNSTGAQSFELPAQTGTFESAQRRDSTMTRLVESIDDVQVQPHMLEKKASQQSIGHPSLAARRQRKPAPIGTAGMRSTSFTSTNPSSPKPVQSHPPERELRRIKSSIGVVNGRVQKSSLAGSAQRSPLSFTFSEAAASARNSKSMSSRSMTSLSVDTHSLSNSLVPVTPLSPPEEDMRQFFFQNGMDKAQRTFTDMSTSTEDSVWANMPNTSDTTTDSIWSASLGANGADSWVHFHSPPGTPLQPSQASANHFNSFSHQAMGSNGGIGWQQQQSSQDLDSQTEYLGPATSGPTSHFSYGEVPHGELSNASEDKNVQDMPRNQAVKSPFEGSTNHTSPKGKATDHSRAKSLSYERPSQERYSNHERGSHQTQQRPQHYSPSQDQRIRSASRSEESPSTPQPTMQPTMQDFQSPQRADQQRQSGLNMFHVGDPDLRNLEPGQLPPNLMPPATPPSRLPQELVIQQFSPRDPVPTDRMPPRARPIEVPKSFEFQMCGPENFSSP